MLAMAPIFGLTSLLLRQAHDLADLNTLDALRGVVMGFGIGLSSAVLIKRRNAACR
jgi:hypothetical protein